MLDVVESWDLTRLPLPPRSLLFPLEPIGMGTPFVESLTSYISRLAEAHAVTVSGLAGYVLANCISCEPAMISARAREGRISSGFHPGADAINGLSKDARRWIAAVETATNRTDLCFLTMTPLQQVFCKQTLFRRVQAWCPGCFSEWRQNELPLYLPLLWHLRMVTICVKHRRRLDDTCPHCVQQFPFLSANAKPGYCSRCRRWLGQSMPSYQEPSQELFHDDQTWTATCVGDVLASMPQLEQDHLRDILRDNIGALVTRVAQGNQRVFCDLTGSPHNGICGWLADRHRPRPDQLFKICSRLRIPASALLHRNSHWNIPDDIAVAGFAASRRGTLRQDPEKLKKALVAALQQDPPPSLIEVALRLNYKTCAPLRRVDPNTCQQISQRCRAYRRRRCGNWAAGGEKYAPGEIETILTESLARERPIPLSHIAAELGYGSERRLRSHFPEFCEAIVRKQAENRDARRAAIRAGLIDAILEEPPPGVGSLASRLRCSHAYLSHHFPDLCQELRNARKLWQVQQREAIRRRVDATAAEMLGASVPEVCRATGVKPLFLLKNFPVLYKRIVSAYVARRDALKRQRTIPELNHHTLEP